MVYLFLLLGFLFLVKGADYFVDGSSSIATSLKIPSLVIGLTIVAFGTSAPEAAVSVTASIQGQNEIALGNIIGSNIFNLLCVAGMVAFIKPLSVKKSILIKEFPFLVLSSILLLVLSDDLIFQQTQNSILSTGDVLVFLMFFCIFMYYLLEVSPNFNNNYDTNIYKSTIPLSKSVVFSVVGILGIVIGGKLVVDCSSIIALNFGVSEKIIGITIVSIGTSLPEFVTSVVSASKGESNIALGNVIGSNIFNVLFILGISSVINPVSIDNNLFLDIFIMIIVTIITYIFSIRKKDINKFERIILIIAYMILVIFKN